MPSSVIRNADSMFLIENRNLYAACSGSVESSDATRLVAAAREIREETGLAPPYVNLVRAGRGYWARDDDMSKAWRIYPFLWRILPFAIEGERHGTRSMEKILKPQEPPISELPWPEHQEKLKSMIKLNWENTDVVFVRPEELKRMVAELVPNLINRNARVVKDHQITNPIRLKRQVPKRREEEGVRGRRIHPLLIKSVWSVGERLIRKHRI